MIEYKKITDLRPHVSANRPMVELEDGVIFFRSAFPDGWVYKLNSEGRTEYEYRTYVYYTYDYLLAIDLVNKNYAMWAPDAVFKFEHEDRPAYKLYMLAKY